MAVDTLWVRHGESTWNRAGLMQGQTRWPPLTSRGILQARAAADTLRHHVPARIVSSDLQRAAQTAHIIGSRLGLPVEPSALLRERCWGVFEGGPADDGNRADSTLSANQAVPLGESRQDVAQRLRRLLPSLTGDDGPVVVVTHGDVIREAIALWTSDGPDQSAVPENGCVVKLSIPLTGTGRSTRTPPVRTRY